MNGGEFLESMLLCLLLLPLFLSRKALLAKETTPSQQHNTRSRTQARGKAAHTRPKSSKSPAPVHYSGTIGNEELVAFRDETKKAFLHAFDSYMTYAFPYDEIKPISCQPRRFDEKERGTLDDVLGGYMLTLVDSLDTLIIMGEWERFNQALAHLSSLSFHHDVTVSVFEANIRVLGGLLSAHQLAEKFLREPDRLQTTTSFTPYRGQLLNLAIDLGDKLLPAFFTRTGIPLHRLNLLKGVNATESGIVTCTAAGGSFLLEFGLLSRLSGDSKYERAARKAINSLWSRRSDLNLIGSLINTHTGEWLQHWTSTGAGVDSFYETLLKSAILFGDQSLFATFEASYNAISHHSIIETYNGVKGKYYVEVDMNQGRNGIPVSLIVSSLSAFWPALQVLAGRVNEGIECFEHFLSLQNVHGFLPDIFDLGTFDMREYARDYPLRPEVIESAYYLHTATKDPKYLHVGKQLLQSLQNISRTDCGYASIADVQSRRLDDRMDSYFLAETLKYLYLLFEDALPASFQSQPIFCSDYHRSVTSDGSMDEVGETSLTSQDGAGVNENSNENVTNAAHDPLTSQRRCIERRSALFSTEGHLFLLTPDVRKDSRARNSNPNPNSKSNSKSTMGTNILYTCPRVI